jgi:glutamate dehydrogenase/leucine dehydrogenase
MIIKKQMNNLITYFPAVKKQNNLGWRNHKEYYGHEFLISLSDEKSGLRAFIAIHNTNLGPALGGTRMIDYKTEDSALIDVLNLSKAMSYKCALANLPYGGGKGVIISSASLSRSEMLKSYARLVDKLGGLIRTGTDVGVSDEDVALMAKETSCMLGVKPFKRGNLTTSKAAALGVFTAMKAVLFSLYGSNDFNSRSVAIKGVGKLGGELARLVSEAGGIVFVSDIDQVKCIDLQKNINNIEIIDNENIHKIPVDIFSPCALGNEFTPKVIKELICKAIVGGANNQLAGDASGRLINNKGILYVPDYIANAGGLIYVADELEPGGFNEQRVIKRISAIEKTTLEIFSQANKQNLPTYKVADMIALSRIQNIKNDK